METGYTMDVIENNEVVYTGLLEDGFMPVEDEEYWQQKRPLKMKLKNSYHHYQIHGISSIGLALIHNQVFRILLRV